MERIRNFVIISHIDHGKSTLADRLIEITGTLPKEKIKPQLLDSMELEREKGITIKMAPVRMMYHTQILISNNQFPNKSQIPNNNFQNYVLNLIDTPGHVDFAYEVSRALACVEGAILLVDATKGIQAQTLANFYAAKKAGLKIIPAINKIDLPSANIQSVSAEIINLTGDQPQLISAKTGHGVSQLLHSIINKIPPPRHIDGAALKALVFDSLYDEHRGVIVYVRNFAGQTRAGDRIHFINSKASAKVLEVGYFRPERKPSPSLSFGEIGYIVTDLKKIEQARVGDTITKFQNPNSKTQIVPIEGFTKPKPMVFASFYPTSPGDYPLFAKALEKLQLTDASLEFEPEVITSFGNGFKIGFLGMLHLEIIFERLKREFGLELITTTPSVAYKQINQNLFEEPYVLATIIIPPQFLGRITKIIHDDRGEIKKYETISGNNMLQVEIPLAEVIINFYDKLKSATQGFGSLDYELIEYRATDLAKLDILIAEEKVQPLTQLVHQAKLGLVARNFVAKLKNFIPRQNFEIKIQAVVGAKIIASERISPLRKDVTAKLYGGDVTRKNKLLKKQKAGKARLKKFGKVDIPTEVFMQVLKR